jgi:hypothetical protein
MSHTRTNSSWLELLASSELLGAILTVVGYAIFVEGRPGTLAGWQVALGLIFATLAGVAGVQLWRGRTFGRRLSLAVQLLQIASLNVTPLVRYVALAGLRVGPVFSSAGVGFRVRGGGEFIAIPFSRDGTLFAVGSALEIGGRFAADLTGSGLSFDVNLLAVYFAWRLYRLRDAELLPAAAPVAPAL